MLAGCSDSPAEKTESEDETLDVLIDMVEDLKEKADKNLDDTDYKINTNIRAVLIEPSILRRVEQDLHALTRVGIVTNDNPMLDEGLIKEKAIRVKFTDIVYENDDKLVVIFTRKRGRNRKHESQTILARHLII